MTGPRRATPRGKSLRELAGSGDDGTTGLLGGGRRRKSDLRVEAYGTVDEASSALGLAKGLSQVPRVREVCEVLQRDLYRLGAELASAPGQEGRWGRVEPADVERLEALMDEMEALAPMPSEFVLPGSTAASGALDLARAVTRRAERAVVRLLETEPVETECGRYLNRLSLLLFVMGRFEEHSAGAQTIPARSGDPRTGSVS